jgi:hypothetical protein
LSSNLSPENNRRLKALIQKGVLTLKGEYMQETPGLIKFREYNQELIAWRAMEVYLKINEHAKAQKLNIDFNSLYSTAFSFSILELYPNPDQPNRPPKPEIEFLAGFYKTVFYDLHEMIPHE